MYIGRIARPIQLHEKHILCYNEYIEKKILLRIGDLILDKQLYTSKKIECEQEGRAYTLEYYITEDEMPLGERISVISYGVEIVMRSRMQIEASRASFLFSDRKKAEDFAEILAKDATFPVSLAGIVEDIMAGQEIPETMCQPKVQCFTASA